MATLPTPQLATNMRNIVTPETSFRTSGSETVPVEAGMLGRSLEAISAGEKGFVLLPLGARDTTKVGGRKWIKLKATALENVRANYDIIVANEQGMVKEWAVVVSIPQLPGALSSTGSLLVDVPQLAILSAAFMIAPQSLPPAGTTITSSTITYNTDGTVATIVFIHSAPGTYTLTFTWTTIAGITFLVNVTRT